jgi:RNA polymerase sigma factor (sigma-70 family)
MKVETFEQLYERRFDDLVRLAAMVGGSGAAAEDIVQDAFANLYLRFHRVEHPESYLRRSVVNGCVSRHRKLRRELLVDDHEDDEADTPSPASDRLDLERRLAGLPGRQRAVVVLRIQLGLSERETADALRCRPGTVGSLLHRALRALRIDQKEFDDAVDR